MCRSIFYDGTSKAMAVWCSGNVGQNLSILGKLFHSEANILTDLPEQNRRNISTRVEGYSCTPSIRVSKLLMRTALADLIKSKLDQNRDYFLWFEDWNFAHFMQP